MANKKEPTSTMQLQQILGTDKANPNFTICRCAQNQLLHVYYGGELFEVFGGVSPIGFALVHTLCSPYWRFVVQSRSDATRRARRQTRMVIAAMVGRGATRCGEHRTE
jgi:hypothetical protein